MCESIINALPYPYLRLRHDEKSSARVAVLGAGGARVRPRLAVAAACQSCSRACLRVDSRVAPVSGLVSYFSEVYARHGLGRRVACCTSCVYAVRGVHAGRRDNRARPTHPRT